MTVNPYTGIQDLDQFLKDEVTLPPIPLHYIVVTHSQSSDQIQQTCKEGRLRDQSSCCCYCFFPFIQLIACVYRSVYFCLISPQFAPGIIWAVSAFLFLVGFCCVCTNQPMKKYGMLIKLFIFSFFIDLISLAYASIYFATHIDESDGCLLEKSTNPNVVNNQVNNCDMRLAFFQKLNNRNWLYFSLLSSGVIYVLSLISIIYLCCVVKNEQPVKYIRATQTEV